MTAPRWLLLVSCPLWILGCQRYVPQPLDLSAYHRSLGGRDPSSAEVVEYARQLSKNESDAPSHYNPADGLSLEESEAVALFFNPRLRTARLRARVPLVGAAEAGRWEDPELRVDAERIVEGVEHPWVLGGILNLTLPLSGRLKIEKDRALAEATAEQLRVLMEEQRLLADLRAAWLEWAATVEQAALTRRLLTELDEIVQSAEKLRAAGELGPLDARLFRIERLTQAGTLQLLDARAREEEIELKARLGLAPAAPVKLVPELALAPRQVPSMQEYRAAVEQHPRLRVARAEYEVAERALQLEVRRQYPDLTVGGGFATDEGDERILGGFGLRVPFWNRNRRAVAEANAARDAARAAVEGEYEQLMAELAKAQVALDAAAARLRFVESELAPLVDEQLGAARMLGKLGDYNTLVLLEALKSAYDAKFELLQARLRLGLATVRVGALVEPGTMKGGGTGKDDQP